MLAEITIGFLEVELVDIIDVVILAILLSQVYKLMQGSIAIKVLVGYVFLYLIYVLVRAVNMELMATLLGEFMGIGILALVILFQQEIRKFLLVLGRTPNIGEKGMFRFLSANGAFKRSEISPIVDAAKALAVSNTGALMVVSKNSELKFYAESGDRMDSLVSKRLLISIFNKFSPLHDGAVILHANRIVSARCILPVTEQENVSASLGLRHRAAIGMSETTDALVVIVSEETGQIAVSLNGGISRNLSSTELRLVLNNYLREQDEEDTSYFDKIKQEESTPPAEENLEKSN
ncbi:MAG: diadenylate cyclase CdaA [Cyclobacteriaceae bacterium]